MAVMIVRNKVLIDGEQRTKCTGIRRGMIFCVDDTEGLEGEQRKRRPWLIVSNERIHLPTLLVLAVPLSSKVDKDLLRGARVRIQASEISLHPAANERGFRKQDSLAITEQVRVLAHRRLLGEPVGQVSASAISAVMAGLEYVFDM